jgi:predicted ester cyclase
MSEQEHIKVAQADYEAFNAHERDTFSRLRAADFMGEGTGAPSPLNVEHYRMFLQGYLTAFPDAHIDVNLMIAQGATTSSRTGPAPARIPGPCPRRPVARSWPPERRWC